MKLTLTILFITVLHCTAAMPRPQAQWLSSAIFYAEGGKHAHPLYGLREGTRTACLARLDREWDAWLAAGHPGTDFVAWLAATWAPIQLHDADDPAHLNRNWAANVRRLYLERVKP